MGLLSSSYCIIHVSSKTSAKSNQTTSSSFWFNRIAFDETLEFQNPNTVNAILVIGFTG